MANMFAHRHYKAMAEALMVATPLASDGKVAMRQWIVTVGTIATMLERDNPRFNRSRFIAACEGDYQNGKDKPK